MIDYKKLLGPPETSLSGRAKNVALGFMIDMLWGALVILFLSNLSPFTIPVGISTFIFSCLFAPLWEELAFRHVPLQIAKSAGDQYVLPTLLLSSVIFGWMHGAGTISLLLQGVGGFIMGCVYIKNGFHYWSSVILHFLWNFFVIFIVNLYN